MKWKSEIAYDYRVRLYEDGKYHWKYDLHLLKNPAVLMDVYWVLGVTMIIFACVNKACFIFLQAMGKAAASTVLSMIREIVFGVGFAVLLPLFFGLNGVLYSMPLSDLLTFAIALVLIVRTLRELRGGGPASNAKQQDGSCCR